jgi:hypothetical protein
VCVFCFVSLFLRSVGRTISIAESDIQAVEKPLVTNYFVPQSLLKRTAKMVSQVKRWRKVAKDGGKGVRIILVLASKLF